MLGTYQRIFARYTYLTSIAAYNYFDLGDPITFGTGGSNNQGTEFTFFIGIKYPSGFTDGYGMFFTGQDGDNFIGQSTGGGWRIDSNQDQKADASGTDIGSGINVIYSIVYNFLNL